MGSLLASLQIWQDTSMDPEAAPDGLRLGSRLMRSAGSAWAVDGGTSSQPY